MLAVEKLLSHLRIQKELAQGLSAALPTIKGGPRPHRTEGSLL